MRHSTLLLQPLLLAALLLTSPARADNAADADKLFKEARALTKEGKLAEACPKYEASLGLDPSAGAAFRLGECFRDTGQFVRAWELFAHAADLARADGRADRVTQAEDAAKALLPKLAFMTLSISPATASIEGLIITLDGEELPRAAWPKAKALKPGTHVLEASAPKRDIWRSSITLSLGEKRSVQVPVLPASDALLSMRPTPNGDAPKGDELKSEEPKREEKPPVPPRSALLITGTILAGASFVTGLGLMGGSFAKASERDDVGKCKGGKGCLAGPIETIEGIEQERNRLANGALYSFIVAGGLGAATLIYSLASSTKAKAEQRAMPVLAPFAGGFTVVGRW